MKINSFLGIRNLAQSRRQPKGALQLAVNLDVDDEGGLIIRSGYSLTMAGTNIVSAYAMRDKSCAYIIDNGSLYRVVEASGGLSKQLLGTVPNVDTYFCEVGNKLFLSTGYIVDNTSLLSWVVNPPFIPIVTIGQGNLLAGNYRVALTTVTADGRESGSSNTYSFSVPGGSGISIANAAGCNVYITPENGDVMYFAGYAVSQISDVSGLNYPMPQALWNGYSLPSNVGPIAYYDSCLYFSKYDTVKNISVIAWSSPFFPHVFQLSKDRFTLPGQVRMMEVQDGVLIIGTNKEIYAWDGTSLVKLALYGVPFGKVATHTRENKLFFQSVKGVCTIPFQNLTEEKLSMPYGNYCSTSLLNINGGEIFVTFTDGSGTTEDSTIF